ncbi:hypothetical protein ACOSP7_026932 [Xanthoceras sorbifolium]
MLITFLSLVVMPHIFNKLSMTLINIFALKTRGCLRYFIGFEPRRSSVDLHLPQHKYVLDLLAKTKMLDSTACLSPAASSVKLSKFEDQIADLLTKALAADKFSNIHSTLSVVTPPTRLKGDVRVCDTQYIDKQQASSSSISVCKTSAG